MGLLRKPQDSYKGLGIGCTPGTHQVVLELLLAHVPHRTGLLDLGARYGALIQRLRDSGFDDALAVDLDTEKFALRDVPLKRLDLNSDFSESIGRTFKIIAATDVLEHLNYPRHFLQQANQLLDDDGYLIVSVPNLAFWEGRIKFLWKGELWGFGEKHYRAHRHISPLTATLLKLLMEEVGYEVVACRAMATYATALRRLLLAPLWLPIRVLGGPDVMGENIVILAKKSAPNEALARPTIYFESWTRAATASSMSAS